MERQFKSRTSGKFLKIACPRCRHRHIVFGKSAANIKCEKCNYLLVQAGGGKAKVRAPVKQVLNWIIKWK